MRSVMKHKYKYESSKCITRLAIMNNQTLLSKGGETNHAKNQHSHFQKQTDIYL